VRVSDGTGLWDTAGPTGGTLATDGEVVCGVDAADPASLGSTMWAWRASDGKLLWQSSPVGGYAAPAMTPGVIYAIQGSGQQDSDRQGTGQLVALRASDGKRLWSRPALAQIPPAAAGAVVYAASPGGALMALRASDGKLIWEFAQRYGAGPLVTDDAVYISDGSMVFALSPATA
jgi:outer membrane protein assembly factor BamB